MLTRPGLRSPLRDHSTADASTGETVAEVLLFATQSLADISARIIAPAISESCSPRILLPNDRAIERNRELPMSASGATTAMAPCPPARPHDRAGHRPAALGARYDNVGAGEGNRTLVVSLEGFCFSKS